jgi:crotonobetaine/carnitine-CoA ligase
MLRRARARVLVTEREAIESLPALEPLGISSVVLTDGVEERARGIAPTVLSYGSVTSMLRAEGSWPAPGDIGCVLYTSGTTGRSKAALISHNQIVRGASRLVDAYRLRADDVFHNWLPLFHLGGLLHMTMTAIIAGGTVALFPTFSRSRFWSEIRETGATVLCGFSAILKLLWSLPASSGDRESSLRIGIIAGIPPELHRSFEERFGLVIAENYGGTEADPLTAPDLAAPPPPAGSFGRPTADFELAIVDADDQPVGPGIIGEIVARPLAADVMFHGYEDDEAATVAAWRNLWYHTGDLGARDERGFFYYRGRSKHAIRRRGENISAFELERILSAHPGISECVAVGVASALGEEEVKVAVVAKRGHLLEPAEIRSFCAERMAGFMVPRYVEIRGALPYTDLGKLEREKLREVTLDTWDAESTGRTEDTRGHCIADGEGARN